MSQNRVLVRLRPGCSDGDPLHVPKQGSNCTQVDPPTLYLEKTGQQWQERKGRAQPGVKYVLEALPNGYTMWQRPRTSDPKHIDKYLYGHPGHKAFDSPNRFYPHFEYLMDNNGSSIGCPCKVCAGSMPPGSSTASSTIPSRPSQVPAARPQTAAGVLNEASSSRPTQALARPQVAGPTSFQTSLTPAVQAPLASSNEPPKGRPKIIGPGMDMTHVDQEGTPDVYRNLIDKLKRYTTIDEIIEEPLSPDWRAEQKVLPGMLQSLRQQAQWIPRSGDVVLFIRELPSGVEVLRHERTGEFQMYDGKTEEFLGTPQWEAGLVTEVPTEPASATDLHRSENDNNVIYSGVRVEPLPNPNEPDKSPSKRYKYISLRQTRPFLLWKELLHEVPQVDWHPTVINALTLTSTVSVFARYRFRGTWPAATTYCHGMHLGSEMLVVGDAVRLLPNVNKHQTHCVDILIIKSIRLKWSDMDKASVNDYDEGRPYTSEIYVYGSAYTSDPLAVNKEDLSEDNVEPPKAAVSYGEWYPLHPASKELAIPYTRILGRLHEQDAMSFWLNSDPDDRPTPDRGRDGLYEARAFARNNDKRITSSPGANWWWGDDRADALNLRTINGLEVSNYDQKRDIRALRKNIKVLDGLDNAKPSSKPSAPPSFGDRDLRRFMAPGTAALPGGAQGVQDLSMSDGTAGSSPSSDETRDSGKKRRNIIDLSDDEEEAEFQRHTTIVDNTTGTINKKSKVAVVIEGN
jgi:hypothetical protein